LAIPFPKQKPGFIRKPGFYSSAFSARQSLDQRLVEPASDIAAWMTHGVNIHAGLAAANLVDQISEVGDPTGAGRRGLAGDSICHRPDALGQHPIRLDCRAKVVQEDDDRPIRVRGSWFSTVERVAALPMTIESTHAPRAVEAGVATVALS
jgi:hypothetical protein